MNNPVISVVGNMEIRRRDKDGMLCGALLSEDRKYRYMLLRRWDEDGKHPLVVIGVNPSTADEITDDNTIRKVVKFAKLWGYSAVLMVNLFAWRDTNPDELPKRLAEGVDIVGVENDRVLDEETRGRKVLCAWGENGRLRNRDHHVLEKILKGRDLIALKLTKAGDPSHPLYMKDDTVPFPFVKKEILPW